MTLWVVLLVTGPVLLWNPVAMASPASYELEPADAVLIRTKEWTWHRYVKESLHLPEWVDVGVEHRIRFEVYDYPWRPSQARGKTDPQIQQRSRLRIGITKGPIAFLFEGQDARVHLVEADDFVNASTRNEMDMLQLLVAGTVRLNWWPGLRVDGHVGRMTMDMGARRLIARNDFRNTTNAFDGFHFQMAQGQDWRLRLFLVEPVLRKEVKLDAQSTRNLFWGIYGETIQLPWGGLNVYYFGLNDQRSALVSQQRTFSTVGFRLFVEPKTPGLEYEIESAWQTGHRGRVAHFAHFQHFALGYTFDLPWSPRVLVFYDYASGDRDGRDGQSSGFDSLFGARRFEFMPTGNFGPFFRTNLSSPGWRAIVVPAKGWKIQAKHRIWYLATGRGAFGSNGIRDSTGGSGNFLGHDLEFRIQWSMSDNLEFDVGYDHWFKGSYFDRLPTTAGLPPGGASDSDYVYMLTKFRM